MNENRERILSSSPRDQSKIIPLRLHFGMCKKIYSIVWNSSWQLSLVGLKFTDGSSSMIKFTFRWLAVLFLDGKHSSTPPTRVFEALSTSLELRTFGKRRQSFWQRSHLSLQLSHFNLRMNLHDAPTSFTWVTHMWNNTKIDFPISPKAIGISSDKLYLLAFRLHSLLSVLAHFGVAGVGENDVWIRWFQLLFLTMCWLIRSFVVFEFRKLSFIARFLTLFSLSRCITCACWFTPGNRLFLVSGWICCWSPDTRSHSLVFDCVIKRRLGASKMLGSPLCAMK